MVGRLPENEQVGSAGIHARAKEHAALVRVGQGRRVAKDEVLITLDKYGPSSQYAQTLSTYQNAKKHFEMGEITGVATPNLRNLAACAGMLDQFIVNSKSAIRPVSLG